MIELSLISEYITQNKYKNGRQRYELPIENHPQYTPKTQEDFTSEIETRSGITPPPWPPNQNDK